MAGVNLNLFFHNVKSVLLRIPDKLLYVLLFISLLVIEYFNFHLCPDVGIQLQTLKNFVSGHGITLTGIDKNNLTCWAKGGVIFYLLVGLTKGFWTG